MNERIFELIQLQNDNRGLLWTEEDKEEFAELMVQECAKICADTAVANPPNDLLEGYNMGVNKAAENIKEHFRVGE